MLRGTHRTVPFDLFDTLVVRPGPFRKGESLTFDASVDDLTRVLALVRPAL